MGKLKDEIFKPNLQAKQVYDLLFAEYVALHDYFGRGQNDVMKRLKHIKVAAKK
jgi:L-ribulokinase